MKNFKVFVNVLAVAFLVFGCISEKKLAEQMKKAMKENPDILIEAIKSHPVEFIETLQQVAQDARGAMAKKREAEETKKFDQAFKNPLKPMIRSDETIRGAKGAPLTLVEYSDFECPFCARGFETVRNLLKKYEGKIQFIYKHLPLSFHRNAMMASQYYEAIRLQSEKKAFQFHDELYANQGKLKKGEKYLKSVAKKLGVKMKKLRKDLNSKKVIERIKEDQKEAAKFGMSGTPGFLLNGIPVKGAYPLSHFEMIIKKLNVL